MLGEPISDSVRFTKVYIFLLDKIFEQSKKNSVRLKEEDKIRSSYEATFINQDASYKLANELNLDKSKRVRFAIPSSHRKYSDADDLPDIDKFVMRSLEQTWVPKVLSKRSPLSQVVNAFRKHYDVIQPYMQVLKNTQPGWYDCSAKTGLTGSNHL